MGRLRSTIHGIGLNDADYIVVSKTGRCPFFVAWSGMLKRCYSKAWLSKRTSYIGCTVVEEWLRFSNFKAWMETQDWEGKELDKDILVIGNKVYGPEQCVFVDKFINSMITEIKQGSESISTGITVSRNGKYRVRMSTYGSEVSVGTFETLDVAILAYKKAKLGVLNENKNRVSEKIYKCLVKRYDASIEG